jgi:hypothetical protein
MEVNGQLHAPAALPPGRNPGTHCIGGCLCPRADMEKRKISCLCWDSNPGPSSMQPSHYTDSYPRSVLSYSVSCFPGTADLTLQCRQAGAAIVRGCWWRNVTTMGVGYVQMEPPPLWTSWGSKTNEARTQRGAAQTREPHAQIAADNTGRAIGCCSVRLQQPLVLCVSAVMIVRCAIERKTGVSHSRSVRFAADRDAVAQSLPAPRCVISGWSCVAPRLQARAVLQAVSSRYNEHSQVHC